MRKIKHCIVFSIILCLAIAPFMKTTTFALSKASNSFLWPVDYTSDTYWISALDVYSSGNRIAKAMGWISTTTGKELYTQLLMAK